MTEPYSQREIDIMFQRVYGELQELKSRPFEKDVRDSLTRVEMEISNLQVSIDTKLEKEREKSDKKYSPMWAWTIMLGILTLIGLAVAQRLVAALGLSNL